MIIRPGRPGQGGHAVPRPQPIKEPGRILDPRRGGPDRIEHPRTGWDNRPITQRPLRDVRGREAAPWGRHLDAVRNERLHRNARDVERNWNYSDRGYYWHDWDGHRMNHHWDGRFHWWGFYLGDFYFWSVYHHDYYWWYDPYWHRWCYHRDGYWWYQNPERVEVIYIYRDGGYYEYRDTTGGVVLNPDPTPPVEAPPADPNPAPVQDPNEKSFYSLDGTRTVQVFGEAKDAFLYDTAETPAFEPKWLASGVTEVRFKLDAEEKLQNILVLTEDGSFALFDKDGEPLNAGQPAEGSEPAPVEEKLEQSALFNALRDGAINW